MNLHPGLLTRLMRVTWCREAAVCARYAGRKVRWSQGAGKRGGVRVVYFNRLANDEIWLILIYAKSAQDNVPANVLKQLKQEIEDAHD